MNSNKQENNKALWTKIILILFVAVVFGLWLANLRNVFDNQKPETDDTWKKINEAFKQIENNSNLASTTASSTKENKFVENLLDKASSTASSTAAANEEKIKNRLGDIMEATNTNIKKIIALLILTVSRPLKKLDLVLSRPDAKGLPKLLINILEDYA